MQTLSILTSLLLATSSLVLANPTRPVCGTCNPLSGQNNCDITTSCINTGTRFHCACRAGYKASTNNNDITKQFRLNIPNYQFLVFTPESTSCNTLCDNPFGAGPNLCAEVPIQNRCEV
ncbi:putative adhesin [Aspergillus nomiae NRRL 13137]|uniref:Putative adhesin n=1 Tax=Aspergillus nomiae NRRL (strain ATCC 15546 / NRRL 13137 / CBS 260.88 / M93) TaxID=1509407 RepID=A0A0L1J248_ASPN3|nr:putative adhesin [Aspergillus nomiae NRRL 13137]KNG85891.1 putative adhesin [Aspergillus nomiae NRRL 13137]